MEDPGAVVIPEEPSAEEMADGHIKSIDSPEETLHGQVMQKLSAAAWRFDRARNGEFLKTLECREIDKDLFRNAVRMALNCKLTPEELDSIHYQFNNKGYVDGPEFLLLFYKFRFEERNKMINDRIEKETKMKQIALSRSLIRDKKLKDSVLIEVPTNFTDADKTSAFQKVVDAAVKYDRLMPGTVQTDAFDMETMRPDIFKEQLRRVFNIRVSMLELGALIQYFDKDGNGSINCADFLVFFFRKGFEEKTKRIREVWEEKKTIAAEKERKRVDALLALKRKNDLKCDFSFLEEDKVSALLKLREAARLYNKATPGACSMSSFEVSSMLPFEFKEALRRVFNLHVTPPELGALMSVFDADQNGSITCAEFSKCFLSMGFAERAVELRSNMERERLAAERRKKEKNAKEEQLAYQNAMKVDYNFSDAEFHSAILKLTDAAWKYDRNMPGTPSLSAFEGETMQPHVFKEQLRKVFLIKLSPPELGALMSYFDKNGDGVISCAEFLITFVKTGSVEKSRRRADYRQYEADKEEFRQRQVAKRQEQVMKKNELKIDDAFTQEQFSSAMAKLTHAAVQYDRTMPGCVKLDAFDGQSMTAPVFKEQLKLVFNVKLNPPELGALMAFFDKEGSGYVNCANFVIQFLRTGIEERARIQKEYRIKRHKKLADLAVVKAEKAKVVALRDMGQVDYEFSETDFDTALTKLIEICYKFDRRTLGPAGWKAFESAVLTPSEFREMMKRTFNVHLNGQELGALVTYFDTTLSGSVSCFSFLKAFVQMRVKTESFKGTDVEEDMLLTYHSQLKDAYKARVQKQIKSNGQETKPWRNCSAYRSVSASTTRKRLYPKTPLDKLKRRLHAGRVNGRIDLSCKTIWRSHVVAPASPSAQSEAGDSVNSAALNPAMFCAELPTNTSSVIVVTAVAQNMKKHDIVITDWMEQGPKPIEDKAAAKNVDGFITAVAASTERKPFDIVLSSVPKDTFRIQSATELWMCNNRIQEIQSDICDIRGLKTVSLNNNELIKLPPEVCLLEKLEKLYVANNNLELLPELFWKLRNLKELDISGNRFTEFPDVLTRCEQLNFLRMTDNEMVTLPTTIINIRSLLICDLSRNPFITDVPEMTNDVAHVLKCMSSTIFLGMQLFAQYSTMSRSVMAVSTTKSAIITTPKGGNDSSANAEVIRFRATAKQHGLPLIPITVSEEEEMVGILKRRAKVSVQKKAAAGAHISPTVLNLL